MHSRALQACLSASYKHISHHYGSVSISLEAWDELSWWTNVAQVSKPLFLLTPFSGDGYRCILLQVRHGLGSVLSIQLVDNHWPNTIDALEPANNELLSMDCCRINLRPCYLLGVVNVKASPSTSARRCLSGTFALMWHGLCFSFSGLWPGCITQQSCSSLVLFNHPGGPTGAGNGIRCTSSTEGVWLGMSPLLT